MIDGLLHGVYYMLHLDHCSQTVHGLPALSDSVSSLHVLNNMVQKVLTAHACLCSLTVADEINCSTRTNGGKQPCRDQLNTLSPLLQWTIMTVHLGPWVNNRDLKSSLTPSP